MATKGLNGKVYQESHMTSPSGNPLTKYVNLCQSAEERRDKYNFARFYEIPVRHAIRLRDWHWPKINIFIQAWQEKQKQEGTNQ